MPNYDEPELNASLELEEVPAKYVAEGSLRDDHGTNFHFAGIARAVDDEQYFDMEYLLGINADLVNINEAAAQKTLEAIIRRRDKDNRLKKARRLKEVEIEKDRLSRKIDRYATKIDWLKEKGSSKALDKIEELEPAVEIMKAELSMIGEEKEQEKANIDSHKKQFFDEERLNKDAHFGAAIKDHLQKREAAAAIDEGNYLSAEPVRCSTGFIETSYLELRMGEAKKISEEICLQIKEAAWAPTRTQPPSRLI